ncbi:hypothetical protein [Persephonella sp.]
MIKAVIKWSQPIEIFRPKKYNTDDKFIEHFRKFINQNDSPLLEREGFYCLISGSLKPEERLSVVLIEESFGKSIKQKIERKKGQIRELKCVYKNYGDENLYLKIGIIESLNAEDSEEVYRKIACKLISENDPSCSEPCDIDISDVQVINEGDHKPLKK